ncbi:DUF2336 domain-containing protein [Salinarimonas sp.]|uniref:DUF2336 domain-containing protein n=1 Tax=Salinarimonas sp. TaxID=2766526 RepID=UPI00391DD327
MSVDPAIMADLEGALAARDPVERGRAGERLADLFLARAPSLAEEHVAVFDEVLEKLVGDITFKARVALAERFADCPNAPRKVVREFASDHAIAVARPVLERCERLDLETLLSVAQVRGQEHLVAMARRRSVPAELSDVIVERGERRVVLVLAGNPGAAFSPDAAAILVARAQTDDGLARSVAERGDAFSGRFATLVAKARAHVRATLVGDGEDPDVVEALIDRIVGEIAVRGDKRTLIGQFAEPMASVQERAAENGLTELDALGALLDGKTAEALCVIAVMQGLPIEFIARAFHAATTAPILVLSRACDFRWRTVKQLLAAKLGRTMPDVLAEDARATYERLGPSTARRVLRQAIAKERGAKH